MSTSALTQTDGDHLDPALMDLLAEALVWCDGPDERARVLVAIAGCAVDAIRWRLQPDGAPEEELSLLQVLDAVGAHRARVQAIG